MSAIQGTQGLMTTCSVLLDGGTVSAFRMREPGEGNGERPCPEQNAYPAIEADSERREELGDWECERRKTNRGEGRLFNGLL